MYPLSEKQHVGYQGEIYAARELIKRGYSVRVPPDFNTPGVDLIINGVLPVEVKYAKQHWLKRSASRRLYPRWQWHVSQVDAQDRILILIAETKDGLRHPFIMPGAIMLSRFQFEINSHPQRYKGILAPFLNNWYVIDHILWQRYFEDGQLPLPGCISPPQESDYANAL